MQNPHRYYYNNHFCHLKTLNGENLQLQTHLHAADRQDLELPWKIFFLARKLWSFFGWMIQAKLHGDLWSQQCLRTYLRIHHEHGSLVRKLKNSASSRWWNCVCKSFDGGKLSVHMGICFVWLYVSSCSWMVNQCKSAYCILPSWFVGRCCIKTYPRQQKQFVTYPAVKILAFTLCNIWDTQRSSFSVAPDAISLACYLLRRYLLIIWSTLAMLKKVSWLWH